MSVLLQKDRHLVYLIHCYIPIAQASAWNIVGGQQILYASIKRKIANR